MHSFSKKHIYDFFKTFADIKVFLNDEKCLNEYEIDCLPVVHVLDTDEEDKKDLQIVGRISKTNITRLFVECGLGRRT